MERIQPIAQPPLGVCEQPQCSLNATIRWMSHTKRVWDVCSALFHYGWELKFKNWDDFVGAIVDAVNYINYIFVQKYKIYLWFACISQSIY